MVNDAPSARAILEERGEHVFTIGRIDVAEGPARVRIDLPAGVARVRKRTAILISGRGAATLAALLRAARAPEFPAEIVLVLSNEPKAAGLVVAEKAKMRTAVVDHRPYRDDRAGHEAAIATILADAQVEIVCLAGYLRMLTPFLVGKYKGRMINIHPSLLPAFPGLDTHARALKAGVKLHGATVHMVTDKLDDGPILAQAAVPVLIGDDEAALAARVLAQEHVMFPLALRLLAGRTGGTRRPPGCTAQSAFRTGATCLSRLCAPRTDPVTTIVSQDRTRPMAQVPTTIDAPVTEEAFLADRMAFWSFFTGLTTKVAIGIVGVADPDGDLPV